MSNDHFYVVIVPNADQAAQALTTMRVALGKHGAKRDPASQRVPTEPPASTRAPAGEHKHTRDSAGKHRSKQPHHSSPESKRLARGSVGGVDQGLHREWSVVVDHDKYNVHDFGTACGYRIDLEGETVWTGVMGRRGQYDTHATKLSPGTLEEVLRLVHVGDRRHAQAPAVRTKEPTSTREAQTKSSTRAVARSAEKPKAKPTAKQKESASPHTPAAPASSTRMKESTAKAKTSAPKSSKKRQTKAATSRPQAAQASPPAAHAKEKAKAKPKARPTAASQSAQAGPLTQRTPVSQPSPKSSSRRSVPRIDDKAVLDEIKANLRQGDPSTAETHFQVMKAIWMRGGREAAVAWKEQHKFSSVVDAFDDWMEKNVATARAMIGSLPPDSQKHERVA